MKLCRRNTTEELEHLALTKWLDLHPILKDFYWHTPNGGKRNLLEAKKLKRMGTKPGIPDFTFAYPIYPYHGAYIELKRDESSKLSLHQREWMIRLLDKGYYFKVCYGAEHAIECINEYLALEKRE